MPPKKSELPLASQTPFDPFVPTGIQIREYDIHFTAIEGLSLNPYVDVTDTFRFLKKRLGCGGAIMNDSELGEVILLQGDHRAKLEGLFFDTEEKGKVIPRLIRPVDDTDARPRTITGKRDQKRLKSAPDLTLLAG